MARPRSNYGRHTIWTREITDDERLFIDQIYLKVASNKLDGEREYYPKPKFLADALMRGVAEYAKEVKG